MAKPHIFPDQDKAASLAAILLTNAPLLPHKRYITEETVLGSIACIFYRVLHWF